METKPVMSSENRFQLPRTREEIGSGAYGKILKSTRRSDFVYKTIENEMEAGLREIAAYSWYLCCDVPHVSSCAASMTPKGDTRLKLQNCGKSVHSIIHESPELVTRDMLHNIAASLIRFVLHTRKVGVAHRDLKLANVTYNGATWIIDFNQCRACPSTGNGFTVPIQTLGSRALELMFYPNFRTYQWGPEVFALGACLWHLFSGDSGSDNVGFFCEYGSCVEWFRRLGTPTDLRNAFPNFARPSDPTLRWKWRKHCPQPLRKTILRLCSLQPKDRPHIDSLKSLPGVAKLLADNKPQHTKVRSTIPALVHPLSKHSDVSKAREMILKSLRLRHINNHVRIEDYVIEAATHMLRTTPPPFSKKMADAAFFIAVTLCGPSFFVRLPNSSAVPDLLKIMDGNPWAVISQYVPKALSTKSKVIFEHFEEPKKDKFDRKIKRRRLATVKS